MNVKNKQSLTLKVQGQANIKFIRSFRFNMTLYKTIGHLNNSSTISAQSFLFSIYRDEQDAITMLINE